MSRILVTGDSRLSGMEQLIWQTVCTGSVVNLEVIVTPGVTIAGAVEQAIKKASRDMGNPYDQIYLMAGVCDLTKKCYEQGKTWVEPREHAIEAGSLNQYFRKAYTEAQRKLQRITKKPVITDLVGMDVHEYNKGTRSYPTFQETINTQIPNINNIIHELNETLPTGAVWSPRFGSYIHKLRQGKLTHRYKLGLRDGIHYTRSYKSRIAKDLTRAFEANK